MEGGCNLYAHGGNSLDLWLDLAGSRLGIPCARVPTPNVIMTSKVHRELPLCYKNNFL